MYTKKMIIQFLFGKSLLNLFFKHDKDLDIIIEKCKNICDFYNNSNLLLELQDTEISDISYYYK